VQGRRAGDDPAQLRPAPGFRRLRDVTRYRADLVAVRTAEKQLPEKLLEDAQIKLSVVASGIFGASAGRCWPR
jgi:transposase